MADTRDETAEERGEPLVTLESVRAAVGRLGAEGKKPTTRAVRDELGGGSHTDILRRLRDLRGERVDAAAATKGEPVQPRRPDTDDAATEFDADPAVRAVMAQLAEVVKGKLTAVVNAERDIARSRIDTIKRDEKERADRVEMAASDRIRRITEESEAAVAEASGNEAEMATALDAAEERAVKAERELATVRERLRAALADVATLTDQIGTLQGEVSNLNHQLRDMHVRAEKAESECDTARSTAIEARRDAETLRQEMTAARQDHAAEIERLGRELADLRQQRNSERARNDKLQEERVAAERAAAEARSEAKIAVADVARLRQAYDDEQGKRIEADRTVVRLTAERDAAVRQGPNGGEAAVHPPSLASAAAVGRRKSTRPRGGAATAPA